jgi:hypothetical protein
MSPFHRNRADDDRDIDLPQGPRRPPQASSACPALEDLMGAFTASQSVSAYIVVGVAFAIVFVARMFVKKPQ